MVSTFMGRLFLDILPAEGFQMSHLAFAGDERDDPGESTLVSSLS